MTKWEYDWWEYGGGVSLDEMGLEGWEAVGICTAPHDPGSYVKVLLKRSIEVSNTKSEEP